MKLKERLLGGGDAVVERARRPEALAATLREPPREGLVWLGRPPTRDAPLLYRALLRLGEAFLFGLCGIRLHVDGRERLPAGGYLLAAAVHRGWIDPLGVLRACPIEPRVWFMGGGPTALDRRWKEWLLRRTGGFLPVWRGGASVETHVEAARAVVQSGAVLGLFFEGGIGGLPDRVARVRIGSGLLALRTNAPIVPLAVCGTGELYRGKRIAARVLPAVTVAELLQAGGANLPEPNSRAELRLARRISDRLAELIDAELASMYPPTVDPPEVPRRWRWLTRLFR